MNDLIETKKYPAQGQQKTEFFGKPLAKNFDMIGLIVSIKSDISVEDYRLIYNGDIEVKNLQEGGVLNPNKPFFMFNIDGKRLLSVPLYWIPCTRYKTNGYSLPLSIKKGQRIDAMIKYPLHKVSLPSGKDNSFRVQLIGKENEKD